MQGAAQNGLGTTMTAAEENSTSAPSELRIGPGDRLEVRVYGAPELSGSLGVRGLGDISMPLSGAIKMAGLTHRTGSVSSPAATPGRRIFARSPSQHSDQGVRDPRDLSFGRSCAPGIYPLLGSPRLLDAIAAAGGTTVRAGKIAIVTHPVQERLPS